MLSKYYPIFSLIWWKVSIIHAPWCWQEKSKKFLIVNFSRLYHGNYSQIILIKAWVSWEGIKLQFRLFLFFLGSTFSTKNQCLDFLDPKKLFDFVRPSSDMFRLPRLSWPTFLKTLLFVRPRIDMFRLSRPKFDVSTISTFSIENF